MSVSVVVPARDAARTLPATLRSLLAQSRPADEILVVDNGSRDGTIAAAQAFGPPVRVLTCARAGAAAARAAGAAVARGARLMFLDADDLIAPDTLEALCAALDAAPGAVAACPWKRFEPHPEGFRVAPASCRPRRPGEDALSAWLTGWYHPPCSVLWSREAYRASGGWDPAVGVNDDGDIALRALAAGVSLAITQAGTGYYRRPDAPAASLSGTRATPAGLASRLFVLDRIAGRLARDGALERHRAALREAYATVVADAGEAEAEACASARAAAGAAGDALADGRAPPRAQAAAGRAPEPAPVATPLPAPAACEDADAPPLVSVVVPAYRRADTLPRAIEGVLSQSHRRLELLVVDDASPDETPGIVARYAAADPRVRLLRQPVNRGVAAAHNRGVAEARGALVAFLDADDEWLPEKLARQVEALARAPAGVGFVYTGVETVRGDGTRVAEPASRSGDVFQAMLARNILHGGGSNALIPRGVFDTVGVFDATLPAAEDYELWLRITRFFAVLAVPEPLIRYYDPGGDAVEDARRRSRNVRANSAAREIILGRFRVEMRRCGVEHLYVLDSARRDRANGAPTALARQILRLARLAPGRAHLRRAALRRLGAAMGARAEPAPAPGRERAGRP